MEYTSVSNFFPREAQDPVAHFGGVAPASNGSLKADKCSYIVAGNTAEKIKCLVKNKKPKLVPQLTQEIMLGAVEDITGINDSSGVKTPDPIVRRKRKRPRKKNRHRVSLGNGRKHRTKSLAESDNPTVFGHASGRMELIHKFCLALDRVTPGAEGVYIQFTSPATQGLKAKIKGNEAAHKFPFGKVVTNVSEIYKQQIASGGLSPRIAKRLCYFGVDVEKLQGSPSAAKVEEVFKSHLFTDVMCVKTRELGVELQSTDSLPAEVNRSDTQMERYLRGRETQSLCLSLMKGDVSREVAERRIQQDQVEHFDLALDHLHDVGNSMRFIETVIDQLLSIDPYHPIMVPTNIKEIRRHLKIITAAGGRGIGGTRISSTALTVPFIYMSKCIDESAPPKKIQVLLERHSTKLRKMGATIQKKRVNVVSRRIQLYVEQRRATVAYQVPPALEDTQREVALKRLCKRRNSLDSEELNAILDSDSDFSSGSQLSDSSDSQFESSFDSE